MYTSSRNDKDVQGSRKAFLVEVNEEQCSRVCFEVPDLSTSEGRAPMPRRLASKSTHSRVEMGAHYYGLCGGASKTHKGFDAVWVIIDRLMKSAHFLHVVTIYKVVDLAKLYI